MRWNLRSPIHQLILILYPWPCWMYVKPEFEYRLDYTSTTTLPVLIICKRSVQAVSRNGFLSSGKYGLVALRRESLGQNNRNGHLSCRYRRFIPTLIDVGLHCVQIIAGKMYRHLFSGLTSAFGWHSQFDMIISFSLYIDSNRRRRDTVFFYDLYRKHWLTLRISLST